jgi:hypothetical protein
MSLWVLALILLIIGLVLYWIENCNSWKANDAAFLSAVFFSAAIVYFIWDLFRPTTSGLWKVIDILLLVLIAFMYWTRTRACRVRGLFAGV